jgi:ribosome maturation factor RimP
MSRIERQVAELVAPVLEQTGLELVGVEFVREQGRRYLRVLLDKEGGVGIEDCERVSHYLSDLLDRTDPIPEEYCLEVGSAGVERPLLRTEDYTRFAGRTVEIRTFAPVDGRRRLVGTLEGLKDGKVGLTLKDEGCRVELPLEAIGRAKLVLDEWPGRGGRKR